MLSRRHGRRLDTDGMEVISQGIDFIAQLFIGTGISPRASDRAIIAVWSGAPCLSRLSVKLSLRFGKNAHQVVQIRQ